MLFEKYVFIKNSIAIYCKYYVRHGSVGKQEHNNPYLTEFILKILRAI